MSKPLLLLFNHVLIKFRVKTIIIKRKKWGKKWKSFCWEKSSRWSATLPFFIHLPSFSFFIYFLFSLIVFQTLLSILTAFAIHTVFFLLLGVSLTQSHPSTIAKPYLLLLPEFFCFLSGEIRLSPHSRSFFNLHHRYSIYFDADDSANCLFICDCWFELFWFRGLIL